MLAVAYVGRLIYIFCFTDFQHYLSSDMQGYDSRALGVASGDFDQGVYWAPFYHLFLGIVYAVLKLVGMLEARLVVHAVLVIILGVISLWFMYQIVSYIWSHKVANRILPILVIWYPLIYVNIFVLSENLFIPLLYAGLYLIVCKRLNWKVLTAVGVVWGLATLTRPGLLVFLPFFCLWLLSYHRSWKLLISFIVPVGILLVAMIGFNYLASHGVTKGLSDGGGFNFTLVWCDLKSIEYSHSQGGAGFGPPAVVDYPEYRREFTQVPFQDQAHYYEWGWECIRQGNPLNTFARNVLRLFDSHIFPRTDSVQGWWHLVGLFKLITLILVLITPFSVWIFSERNRRYLYLLLGLFFANLLTVVQAVGEERYLIPYAPILIMLNGGIFTVLFHAWRRISKGLNR